jgi:hypothetical protein
LTNSINGMRIAGIVLAVAICCAVTQAGAQEMRVFMGPGGSGNTQAPGSAGMGTAGLGLGGFGSATENMRDPGTAGTGAGQGLLLNKGAGNALGVTGGAGAPAQGSLSSAIDRPSSPINSVTNSLMGSVGTGGTTIPAAKPAAKRKPSTKAAAASPGGGDAATASTRDNPAKSP